MELYEGDDMSDPLPTHGSSSSNNSSNNSTCNNGNNNLSPLVDLQDSTTTVQPSITGSPTGTSRPGRQLKGGKRKGTSLIVEDPPKKRASKKAAAAEATPKNVQPKKLQTTAKKNQNLKNQITPTGKRGSGSRTEKNKQLQENKTLNKNKKNKMSSKYLSHSSSSGDDTFSEDSDDSDDDDDNHTFIVLNRKSKEGTSDSESNSIEWEMPSSRKKRDVRDATERGRLQRKLLHLQRLI